MSSESYFLRFFILKARKFHFWKFKKVPFLVLNISGFRIYLSWNIRKFPFPEHYENFFWENTKNFFREVPFRKNCINFFKGKSWELRLESARGRPIIHCNRQYQFHFPFSSNFLRENFVRSPCFLSSAYWFSLNIPGKTFSWIPSICSTI